MGSESRGALAIDIADLDEQPGHQHVSIPRHMNREADGIGLNAHSRAVVMLPPYE